MKAIPAFLVISFFGLQPAKSQSRAPGVIDWQTIRDAQPAGLSLRLELPKKKFHLGEIIDATLVFSNSTSSPHFLWAGTSDRTGRIPDIAFRGTDQHGRPVKDPLDWYLQRQFRGGGGGHFQELGRWEITLPANQWLRFDRPGVYQIFAYSDRPRPGGLGAAYLANLRSIPLVSDKVEVEIGPLSPEGEAGVIASATRDLAADEKTAQRAATTLQFLGTPRSREALLPLLDSVRGQVTALAFAASPTPEIDAQMILDAVSSGKLALTSRVAELYARLSTAGVPDSQLHSEEGSRQEQEFVAKITQAAAKISGDQGANYYQSQLVALQLAPRGHNPAAREALVKAQLELSPDQMSAILDRWGSWGGEDFLPLLRKALGPPTHSHVALEILCTQWPDEARPLVIEDIQREQPIYLVPNAVPKMANRPLLSLPRGVIPELEAFFRRRLVTAQAEKDFHLLMPAIDRYGSPALLPDVVRAYQPNESRWACELQNSALRFWIRADRPAGLAALARALDSRDGTGCYKTALYEVLRHDWKEDALPIVTPRLSDPDPQVVESAVQILKQEAGVDWTEPSVQAAERLFAKPRGDDDGFFASRRIAQLLLDPQSPWPLSPSQKDRLEAVLAKPPRR